MSASTSLAAAGMRVPGPKMAVTPALYLPFDARVSHEYLHHHRRRRRRRYLFLHSSQY